MQSLHMLAAGAALAVLVPLTGCTGDLAGSSTGTVRVSMTDSPADFEAVNVVVTEVALHRAGSPDSSGWETIDADSTQYDLLELRNGVFASLGIAEVPAGHYTQLRLVLSDDSHVVIAGLPVALTLGSETRTGVKLAGSWEVREGESLELGLDFDAGRSIVETGAGRFQLKPVIRVVAMDAAGAITGTVSAGGAGATVTAMQGGNVIASAETAADGRFTLSALPTGTYTVQVHAALATYQDSTIADVTVRARAVTNIGTCALAPAI